MIASGSHDGSSIARRIRALEKKFAAGAKANECRPMAPVIPEVTLEEWEKTAQEMLVVQERRAVQFARGDPMEDYPDFFGLKAAGLAAEKEGE